MNAFHTTRRRAVATTLAAGALLLGGVGATIAPAVAAPSFGSGATGSQGFQGFPGLSGTSGAGISSLLSGLFAGKGTAGATGTTGMPTLPGMGVFKALFALLGAVQTQVPTIAAPIISQAQTAGTITAAEAAQLTTLFAAKPMSMPMTMGAGMGSGMGAGAGFTKPSTGELTVLHAVIAAVLGQLPTITAPVLVTEVANGDLTQAEADGITKLIAGLSSMASNNKALGSAASGLMGSTSGAGNFLATLESTLGGKSTTPKVHKHHKHHKVTSTVRTHRSN